QQSLDLPFELLLRRDARMLLRDAAITAHDHRDRNAIERPERILHVLMSVADEHWIVHLELSRVRLQLVGGIVDRDAEDREGVAILVLQFHERRDLRAAWPAPRRPEVDQHDLALER